MRRRGRAGIAVVAAALVAGLASMAAAQRAPSANDRARRQQAQLDSIRNERAALEQHAQELRASLHDISDEVVNLDRRADATARIVHALDEQLSTISEEVTTASAGLVTAEDQLTAKRAILQRRLADIYMRGPLFTFEALLSAQSFGELVARYKYLHLLALRDRSLVRQVERLRDQVGRERTRLVELRQAIADNRTDKSTEEDRLRDLQREQEASLVLVQRNAQATEARIARLRRTEQQLANAIAALEAERRRAEARSSAPRTASTIRTSDFGRLDWPVDGVLVYTFGKAQTASNTTIRWNGVGIRASVNAPVRAVADGRVVSVRQLGTYGLTVIVDHGGGDYSVYGSLARADVREGQTVAKGDMIGGVGVSDPDLPPHLHFEIRRGGPAVDPADWLRARR